MCVTNTVTRRTKSLALSAKLADASNEIARTLMAVQAVSSGVTSSFTNDMAPQQVPSDASFATSASSKRPYSRVSSMSSNDSAEISVSSQHKTKRRRKPQPPGKTAKMNDRHFVVHNYHDHSMDVEQKSFVPKRRCGGNAEPFPLKLHAMLEQIQADGLSDIISWQPHGRCFVIHQPKEFTEIMPKYFRQTKLTSFQRQLNLYGFCRLTKGPDNRGYYHELFLRGMPHLCQRMVRIKVKGTGFKAASSPDSEPDFYSMPFIGGTVTPSTSSCGESSTSSNSSQSGDTLTAPAPQEQQQYAPYAPPSMVVSRERPVSPLCEPQATAPAPLGAPNSLYIHTGPAPAPIPAPAPQDDLSILDSVVDELFLEAGSVESDDQVMDFVSSWNGDVVEPVVEPNNTNAVDDEQLGQLLQEFLGDSAMAC